MLVCLIERFETITGDSGTQLEGEEEEVSLALLAKLKKKPWFRLTFSFKMRKLSHFLFDIESWLELLTQKL